MLRLFHFVPMRTPVGRANGGRATLYNAIKSEWFVIRPAKKI